jgi:hypothetical protein
VTNRHTLLVLTLGVGTVFFCVMNESNDIIDRIMTERYISQRMLLGVLLVVKSKGLAKRLLGKYFIQVEYKE